MGGLQACFRLVHHAWHCSKSHFPDEHVARAILEWRGIWRFQSMRAWSYGEMFGYLFSRMQWWHLFWPWSPWRILHNYPRRLAWIGHCTKTDSICILATPSHFPVFSNSCFSFFSLHLPVHMPQPFLRQKGKHGLGWCNHLLLSKGAGLSTGRPCAMLWTWRQLAVSTCLALLNCFLSAPAFTASVWARLIQSDSSELVAPQNKLRWI